jgi:hypothetical protein
MCMYVGPLALPAGSRQKLAADGRRQAALEPRQPAARARPGRRARVRQAARAAREAGRVARAAGAHGKSLRRMSGGDAERVLGRGDKRWCAAGGRRARRARVRAGAVHRLSVLAFVNNCGCMLNCGRRQGPRLWQQDLHSDAGRRALWEARRAGARPHGAPGRRVYSLRARAVLTCARRHGRSRPSTTSSTCTARCSSRL